MVASLSWLSPIFKLSALCVVAGCDPGMLRLYLLIPRN
jgi:hypothetical protein